MKNISILVFLMSQAVFAANPTVLLSSLTAGGMPGPKGPSSYQISIMSDGSVVSELSVGRTAPLTKNLAQLSNESLNNVKSQIARINPNAKLVAPPIGAPRCMDAPFTRIDAIQGSNTLEIWLRQDCLTSKLEDGSDGRLVELITALESLSNP